MNKFAVIGGVACALLVAVWLIEFNQGADSLLEHSHSSDQQNRPIIARKPPVQRDSSAQVEAIAQDSITTHRPSALTILRIVDENGALVTGAIAYVPSPTARYSRKADVVILGESNSVGMISFASTNQPRRVRVYRKGFLQADVVDPATGDYRVTLLRGEKLSVRTQFTDGEPLEGVKYYLSQRSVAGGLDLTASDIVPGYDETFRIHSATSDDQGRITITGLTPGAYLADISHPHYVCSNLMDEEGNDRRIIEIPSAEQDLLFLKVYANVVRFDGDTVLGCTLSKDGRGVTDSLSSDFAHAMADGLRERFPESFCLAYAPRPHPSTGIITPGNIVIDAFLRTSGVRKFTVPVIPIGEITAPHVIKVERGARDLAGRVTAVIEDTNGRVITDVKDIELMPDPRESRMGARITHGVMNHVRPGEYRVRAGGLESFFENDVIEIEAGKDHEVVLRLTQTVRRCNIVVETGVNGPLGSFILRLWPHEGRGRMLLPKRSEVPVWLPVGKLKLKVQAFGFSDATVETIVNSPDGTQQDIVVHLQ